MATRVPYTTLFRSLLPRRGDGAFRLVQLQLVVEAGVDALAAQVAQARGARLLALRDVEYLARLRKCDVAARDAGRQRQPRGLGVDLRRPRPADGGFVLRALAAPPVGRPFAIQHPHRASLQVAAPRCRRSEKRPVGKEW